LKKDQNKAIRIYLQYLYDTGERELFIRPGSISPYDELKEVSELEKEEGLKALYDKIKDCHRCPLGERRTNLVFGTGHPNADLMFIGEAPGRDEDLTGIPFVGRAGKLLDRILAAMTIKREDVYIANILKCRPPGNRDPLPSEIQACEPYLKEQIRIIDPKVICCLGRIAAQVLLDTNLPMKRLRGTTHNYMDRPLVATYHPAALLRNASFKKPTWEDMQLVMKLLGINPPK